MMRDAKLHRIGGRTSSPRTGLIVSALLALVALATACAGGSSGPGVAGQGAASSPSASPSGDLRDAQLAYAQCMRDHGISEFPDPEPGGGIAVVGEPGGELDPNNPRFQAADEACQSLLPPPAAGEEEQSRAEGLRYARCMREHGFPDFPDPNAEGGIDLDLDQNPALDPSNPRFQEANEACGGPTGADTNTQTSGDGS
jgi:hypothetical protein